jgi:small conductance mechanosensitive channel
MPRIPVQELILDLAVRYGFQILGALAILVAGSLVARWAGRLADRRLGALEPPMRILAGRAVRIVVLLFAAVLAIDKFGFQIAPLVAGIGVAGLGIGIALQGVLSNMIAGLTIILTKPYRVGEYIELLGVHGDVIAIELFSTTLRHPDRSRVVVPNRKIVGEILHNFGTMRQLKMAVTVPLHADVAPVLAAARAVVEANARVLADPPPILGYAGVGPSGLSLAIKPWVRVPDVVAAEAEIYQALIERFRALGVEFPVSQHAVRLLANGPGAVAVNAAAA